MNAKFATLVKHAKKGGTRLAAVAGSALMVAQSARAAVPTEVDTALGSMKADGVSMATIVLVAIIAVFAIKFLRKGV